MTRRKDCKPTTNNAIDCNAGPFKSHLLLSLEVVEENRAFLRLLTPVFDDDARAVDDLTGVTLTVKLAY